LRELPDFIGSGQIVLFNHGAAISGEGALVGVEAAAAAFSVPDWARRSTVLHCAVRPRVAVNLRSGEQRPLSAFATAVGFTGVHAVAGIGHPERFFSSLRAAGVMLAAVRALPDHHAFTAADFSGLEGVVLMTDKDAVKCAAFARPEWWRVEAELQFAAGADEQLLQAALAVVG
jgi:tetraacyldisaccharide-1-P 4'-kinase